MTSNNPNESQRQAMELPTYPQHPQPQFHPNMNTNQQSDVVRPLMAPSGPAFPFARPAPVPIPMNANVNGGWNGGNNTVYDQGQDGSFQPPSNQYQQPPHLVGRPPPFVSPTHGPPPRFICPPPPPPNQYPINPQHHPQNIQHFQNGPPHPPINYQPFDPRYPQPPFIAQNRTPSPNMNPYSHWQPGPASTPIIMSPSAGNAWASASFSASSATEATTPSLSNSEWNTQVTPLTTPKEPPFDLNLDQDLNLNHNRSEEVLKPDRTVGIKSEEKKKKLDLYASIYVPAWLLEVNRDEAHFQVPHQFPEAFHYETYSSKFLTKHILENSEKIENEAGSEDDEEGEEDEEEEVNKKNQNQNQNPLSVNSVNKFNSPWSPSSPSPFLSSQIIENQKNVNSSLENQNQIEEKNQENLIKNQNQNPELNSNYNDDLLTGILKNKNNDKTDSFNNETKNNKKQSKEKNQKNEKESRDFSFSDEKDFDPTLSTSTTSETDSSDNESEVFDYRWKEKQASFLKHDPPGKADWSSSIGAIAQGLRTSSSGKNSPSNVNHGIFVDSSSNQNQINFSTKRLLHEKDEKEEEEEEESSTIPIEPNVFPPLESKTYVSRFEKLISLEMESRILDLSKQSLFEVSLESYGGGDDDSSLGLYSLSLPGIREDRPHLIPGDKIELRPLTPFNKSWLRLSFESHITSIRAIEGKIILDCKELESSLKEYFSRIEIVKFNVIFHPKLKNEKNSLESLKNLEIYGCFERNHRIGKVLKRWLFPNENHSKFLIDEDEFLWKGNQVNYFDERLNEEQKDAVEKISSRKHKIPFLISGPPGTGKTKTIVEATLQILHRQSQSTILLVAPSNTAADTLALRLSDVLKNGEMIRLNDASRTFAEVPEKLILFCSIDEDSRTFCLPDFKSLMKARVIITTTFDASLLVKARVTNSDLARLNHFVKDAIQPRRNSNENSESGFIKGKSKDSDSKIPLHFTHLIVDETGQGTEIELSSVFSIILPSKFNSYKDFGDPILVFCGDHNQLGPRIQSHEARSNGLDISILERLWERPVYNSAMKRLREGRRRSTLKTLNDSIPLSLMKTLNGVGNGIGIGNSKEPIIRKEKIACHLVQNYRARHPALLMVPSSLFYSDTLRPADLRQSELRNWDGLPNKGFPLVFESVEGEDKWVDEGVSWHNPAELRKVIELIQSLTGIYRDSEGKPLPNKSTSQQWISPKEIAVISPYREQVWRLRLALRKRGLTSVNVGTVEVFQGSEHSVTIISTVRTRERFLKDDLKNNLGLIFERKRFCVATTRAKELLIIVGNPNLLKVDPYWRCLLELVIRKKSFRGEKVVGIDPLSASDVSTLEVLYNDEIVEEDGDEDDRKDEGENGKKGKKSEEKEEEKVRQTVGRVVATALGDME